MIDRIKHTYYYEIATEREAVENLIHIKTLGGFTLKGDTQDQRKGVGRVDLVKTIRVSETAANA